MKKSVYSLVLMDDVVEAIDELAYRMNTSRSNLINQILAEKVSYITPEQRMRNVFDCIVNMMDSHFQVQSQTTDAMLSIRSPLRFKYKPTIRYRVELLKEVHESLFGYLTISFRTQNVQLLNALESFFRLWRVLENKYNGDRFENGIEYSVSEGKYIRSLKLPINSDDADNQLIGEGIGKCIDLIDSGIKLFFANLEVPDIAVSKSEKLYSEKGKEIIV